MRALTSISVLATAALACAIGAQPAPPPPAPPATAATQRYVMTVPEGFEKLTVGSHTMLCQPQDVEWVRGAVKDMKPATRPTTMPADLLKRVTDGRAALIGQMVADLALPDDKATSKFLDDELRPTLQKFDALRPPVFFLICTRDKLRDVVKNGWGEPRFHYNRLANEVGYQQAVNMTVEGPMDDAVLPGFYNKDDPAEKRAKELADGLASFDANIAETVARDSQLAANNLIAEFIGKTCFEPLKAGRDQQWLGLGVTSYFAGKYAAALTNRPLAQWLDAMTYENPRYALSSRGIDLLHPIEESSMRKEAVPFYLQAMRRKATVAVRAWVAKSGEASLTKVVAAVHAKPPADGAALLKLIQDQGGPDLSKELGVQ